MGSFVTPFNIRYISIAKAISRSTSTFTAFILSSIVAITSFLSLSILLSNDFANSLGLV